MPIPQSREWVPPRSWWTFSTPSWTIGTGKRWWSTLPGYKLLDADVCSNAWKKVAGEEPPTNAFK